MHESLRDRLFSLQDTAYRDFHSRLIPNIDPERVIRHPHARAPRFCKGIFKDKRSG